MISVFICEDERYYQDMLVKCVKNYIQMEELDMEVVLSTDDPAKIIQYIQEHKVNGLYFFDVELGGGYNGVEVAEVIRRHDPRGFIVFVTAHQKYMTLTFKYRVEALAYIEKADETIARREICECIKNAYQKHISRTNNCFCFKTSDGRRIACEYEDILFFETDRLDSRRVILHTKKRLHIFYSSLSTLDKTLPKGLFFRCHKSFIAHIGNLPEGCKDALNENKDRIIMQDGSECFISVRKARVLLKLLSQI